MKDSDAIFITVGTPQSETGEADLSYVEAVAYEMASAILMGEKWWLKRAPYRCAPANRSESPCF